MISTKLLLLLVFVCSVYGAETNDLEWWDKTVFYQIYPRSFMDSNGDGIGDLNGITSKLEYLKELGIGATWLSPIFKSPMYDFGYDIADFYEIQEEYGTMEDFNNLLAKAKELDIKIILDFVPNHTSNESVWFEKALQGDEKYLDYFVWEDGIVDEQGVMHPPNNWLSVFRGSAWEYRPEVGKYYLHQFVVGQPDLNYNNPEVVSEMKNVLRFWLEKGVAGVRVDAIPHLFEVEKELFDGKYPDEPLSGNINVDSESYAYLDHIYTKNQYKTYDMVYQWRELLEEVGAADGLPRVMMTEASESPFRVMKYFGDGERLGSHIPFNFNLIGNVGKGSSAQDIKFALDTFLTYKPIDQRANWVIGNHDNNRAASRYGRELADSLNMIVLLSPGIGVTYMGEEIGMEDGFISWEETVDPSGCNTYDPINYWKESRDPERTPFQWNAGKNAGFSTADKTWLPVADTYKELNVENQYDNPKSHLNLYKALIKLRNEKAFMLGRYESVAFNDDVFAFKRWYKNEIYVVLINLRNSSHILDLTYFENVEGKLEVILANGISSGDGTQVNAENLNIAEYESLVLKVVN